MPANVTPVRRFQLVQGSPSMRAAVSQVGCDWLMTNPCCDAGRVIGKSQRHESRFAGELQPLGIEAAKRLTQSLGKGLALFQFEIYLMIDILLARLGLKFHAMPKAAALEALIKAYQEEIRWLFEKAKEHQDNGPVAADYIHRARNLQAVTDAYSRLDAKSIPDA